MVEYLSHLIMLSRTFHIIVFSNAEREYVRVYKKYIFFLFFKKRRVLNSRFKLNQNIVLQHYLMEAFVQFKKKK